MEDGAKGLAKLGGIGAALAWEGPLPEPHEVAAARAGRKTIKAGKTGKAGRKRGGGPGRPGGPVGSVRYSAAVARRLCERVESGESLRAICADPDMPHRGTVKAWRERIPKFGAILERARTAAGWHFQGGQKPMWCEQLARQVCARMAEGELLSRICAEPEMPSLGVVYKWRAARPEFAAAMRLAREAMAERFCDLGWEIACEVTPENAYATRVKLAQLRWTASHLAPRRFGRFKAVEAEVALEAAAAAAVSNKVNAWLVKHFKVEEREDGARRVVTFVPDPRTNQVVRMTSQDGPWEPAPAGRFQPSKYAVPMEGSGRGGGGEAS